MQLYARISSKRESRFKTGLPSFGGKYELGWCVFLMGAGTGSSFVCNEYWNTCLGQTNIVLQIKAATMESNFSLELNLGFWPKEDLLLHNPPLALQSATLKKVLLATRIAKFSTCYPSTDDICWQFGKRPHTWHKNCWLFSLKLYHPPPDSQSHRFKRE